MYADTSHVLLTTHREKEPVVLMGLNENIKHTLKQLRSCAYEYLNTENYENVLSHHVMVKCMKFFETPGKFFESYNLLS